MQQPAQDQHDNVVCCGDYEFYRVPYLLIGKEERDDRFGHAVIARNVKDGRWYLSKKEEIPLTEKPFTLHEVLREVLPKNKLFAFYKIFKVTEPEERKGIRPGAAASAGPGPGH